jgi:hypothetical protein
LEKPTLDADGFPQFSEEQIKRMVVARVAEAEAAKRKGA